MGKATLNQLAGSPTTTPAAPEQYNALVQALEGDIVMRNLSGIENDGDYNIGESANGRPGTVYVKDAIILNGQPLTPSVLSGSAINSGAATADGFPAFLAIAGGPYFNILGAATPLKMVIDGMGATLSVNLQSAALALAPSSNNTATINDALLGVQNARTIGEFGYWITINAIGSAITALNGKVAAFKVGAGPEVFLATVDTTNNRLIPIYRAIGGTTSDILTNGGTITLLAAYYIFLHNDMLTIDTTATYPTWSATAPAGPAAGDYWWDVTNQTWKKWNGATWIIAGATYLGMAICDASVGCLWVEPEDFNIAWSNQIQFKEILTNATTGIKLSGPINVSVAGKQVTISADMLLTYSAAAAGWAYIYIDQLGGFTTSIVPPSSKKSRQGYYMPGSYKRLIGAICASSQNVLVPSRITSDGYLEGLFPVLETLPSGTATVQAIGACPISDSIDITIQSQLGTGGSTSYGVSPPGSVASDYGITVNAIQQSTSGASSTAYVVSRAVVKCIKSGFWKRTATVTGAQSQYNYLQPQLIKISF